MVTDGFQGGLEGPIRFLIREVFRKKPNNKNGWAENVKLIKQLKEEGDIIVDLVLENLYFRKGKDILKICVGSSRNSPVFHLIYAACELAQPRHANQLAQMLLWWEIFKKDRSIQGSILEAMERIGDWTVVVVLREYSERLQSERYPSRSALDKVERVIITCQKRG